MTVFDLAEGFMHDGVKAFGYFVGNGSGCRHYAVAGFFCFFFAVLHVYDFHMVVMLDNFDNFAAKLYFVAEFMGNGLGQCRGAAYNVAGKA